MRPNATSRRRDADTCPYTPCSLWAPPALQRHLPAVWHPILHVRLLKQCCQGAGGHSDVPSWQCMAYKCQFVISGAGSIICVKGKLRSYVMCHMSLSDHYDVSQDGRPEAKQRITLALPQHSLTCVTIICL